MSIPPKAPQVFAIGNRYRQDDGVGPWIAKQLREAGFAVLEVGDDLTRLVEGLAGADEAIVVEAVVSGHPAGTLHVLELSQKPLPSVFERFSSHAFGLAQAIELSRTLGSLPKHTIIYGIEGQRFGSGEELSPEVMDAARELVQRILADSNALVTAPSQSVG